MTPDLGGDAAERGVAAGLRLQQGEDEQQAHARGEGGLLGLLQQALAFQQGQRLLVAPGALALLLLLQRQLPLRPPQAAQRVQPVLQQPRIRVALVAAHRAQTLRELRRVLGLEGEDLRGGEREGHWSGGGAVAGHTGAWRRIIHLPVHICM